MNLIIYCCVLIVFFSPVVIGHVFFWLTRHKYHLVYANLYLLFWAGPFTPAIPLQLAITFGIRKLINKIAGKEVKIFIRKWKFDRNIYDDNSKYFRSRWHWGSGRFFWQWYSCPVFNQMFLPTFDGTRAELRRFLEAKQLLLLTMNDRK